MAWKKYPLPFFSLVCLLTSCDPSSPRGFCAGLGEVVSDGDDSYLVSSVIWSNDFILFNTELSFHEIHIADIWGCIIYYGFSNESGSFSCPFNKEKTNQLNSIQIQEDNILSVDGVYVFAFDQVLESPTEFINSEDAYIELDLFVVQSDYQQSWAWIPNQDITFETE